MNTKAILAIVALAAAASTGVRADEADASQYAVKFEGTRTRAEVKAEAATVSIHPQHRAGRLARCVRPMKSNLDPKLVRADAAEAVRLGQTSRGEIGYM